MYVLYRTDRQIKYGHSEVGNFTLDGYIYEQNEIEFLPVPVSQAADQLMIAKWVIRNLGYKYGYNVTFAPKITAGKAGSGLHIHMRIMKDGKNQMLVDGVLSETARKAIAGMMVLAPSITAFGNTNPTSYLIKNIESYTYTWNWNDLTNKRSYWATSAAGTLEHASYNDMDLNAKYCLENTSANHTKMVVAAELQINGTATTLIQWRNNLYTEDGFKTQIANLSDVTKYFICTNEDAGAGVDKIYVSLTKDNLEFAYNTNDNPNVTDKDWQAIVKVNDKTSQIYTIATVGGEKVATPVSKETVNASFANIATFKMWNGGKTYFFTDIEHNGDLCGIVRNHLYNLTISSITGLGTPVPNPDKEIIPEKPTDDEESYIAAKVEILSYKVVSQSVDLN